MINDILKELRDQLAMYEDMAREEKENTGGETHGTCAYLDGAIVASRRAVEIVERLRAELDWVTLAAKQDLHRPLEASTGWRTLTPGGTGES